MVANSKDAGGIPNVFIPPPMIRAATLGDLESLIAIEKRAFELDRFSRRTFFPPNLPLPAEQGQCRDPD